MDGGTAISFSLRNVLDAMVFGMSHIPGFSALSIPVFISNYLFDLFSQFFLILTLFALAVMAYDGLRRGKQSLKEDAINLSLVIITVFLILQFKDKSVKYGSSSAYGIVTVYSGLLQKGEDIADALTYAMLFNNPSSGRYAPGKAVPTANTPLEGIVENSFFSFIVKNGELDKEALKEYIRKREEHLKGQAKKFEILLKQKKEEEVFKNTFNIAHGFYIVANSNKNPQGVMFTPFGGANINDTTMMEKSQLYEYTKGEGLPLDALVKVSYWINDGQTPSQCILFTTKFKQEVKDKNNHISHKPVFDFSNAKKIESLINDIVNLNYFDKKSISCDIPSSIGTYKDLAYPYILQKMYQGESFFWDTIYQNLTDFMKDDTGKAIIGADMPDWEKLTKEVETIRDFYKQAAEYIKNNAPIDKSISNYNLIFPVSNDKNNVLRYNIISKFSDLREVRKSLNIIFQDKLKLIQSYTGKNSSSEEDFINMINNTVLKDYLNAIDRAYNSLRLISPNVFLKRKIPGEIPDVFKNSYQIVSTIITPYIAVAGSNAITLSNSNLVNLYNNLQENVYRIYTYINSNGIKSFGGTAAQGSDNKYFKTQLSNVTKNNKLKGKSLNDFVAEEYGYDPKIDLLFPGSKIPLSANTEKYKEYLKKNSYSSKQITWVDLGYYFSAIKAYTSNFVIFSTYALANNAFSTSAKISGKEVEKAIEIANRYKQTYQKNFSDSAKMNTLTTDIANTLTIIKTVKELKNFSLVKGKKKAVMLKKLWGMGFIKGFFVTLVKVVWDFIKFGATIGITFVFVLILSTLIFKLIIIVLPAMFWMIAVLNWFFKSAMMLIMLPVNVFLMFFKSRRQVFFQALWKLLAQMLTPVALVATFFVVIVFSIEIDFLLNYFVPFLNDNIIAYIFSDEGMRRVVEKIVDQQYENTKQTISEGGFWGYISGAASYVKAWLTKVTLGSLTAHIPFTDKTILSLVSAPIVKILSFILLLFKTIIIFVIDLHLYMLFFRADDYIREVLGEVFGAATGFDSSMERIMGKFGANRIT